MILKSIFKLVYTPMINARQYADPRHQGAYRSSAFDIALGEEGGPKDRPLIVQVTGPSYIRPMFKD